MHIAVVSIPPTLNPTTSMPLAPRVAIPFQASGRAEGRKGGCELYETGKYVKVFLKVEK